MTYAAAVLARCDELAAFSEEPGRLTRRFATPALWQAGERVREWMEAAGMAVRRDAIGNLIGRLGGGGLRTLLVGSHLDTVRDAGRYDGMLGVLVAIACLERLRDQGWALPYAVELLAFADEEEHGAGWPLQRARGARDIVEPSAGGKHDDRIPGERRRGAPHGRRN